MTRYVVEGFHRETGKYLGSLSFEKDIRVKPWSERFESRFDPRLPSDLVQLLWKDYGIGQFPTECIWYLTD